MNSVLLIIASLIGTLIVLLAIPIDLAFNIQRIGKTEGHVKVRWLFGLLRFRINIPIKHHPHPAKRKRKVKTEKPSGQRKQKSGRPGFLVMLKQSRFRRRLLRFIKDLLRAAHSRDLFLHLRIGLGDPADTGRLWIFLGPVAALAANVHSAVIRIEPAFMDPVFEFHGRGAFRLTPLELFVVVITFALSPPSLRAWRTSRAAGN